MTPGNVDDSASGCHSDALRCNVLSVEYKYGTKADEFQCGQHSRRGVELGGDRSDSRSDWQWEETAAASTWPSVMGRKYQESLRRERTRELLARKHPQRKHGRYMGPARRLLMRQEKQRMKCASLPLAHPVPIYPGFYSLLAALYEWMSASIKRSS